MGQCWVGFVLIRIAEFKGHWTSSFVPLPSVATVNKNHLSLLFSMTGLLNHHIENGWLCSPYVYLAEAQALTIEIPIVNIVYREYEVCVVSNLGGAQWTTVRLP